jgi:uncharacterized protein
MGQLGAAADRAHPGHAHALPALLPDARDPLLAFSFVAIDDHIVEGATSEPDRGLRSLDAIHPATAAF